MTLVEKVISDIRAGKYDENCDYGGSLQLQMIVRELTSDKEFSKELMLRNLRERLMDKNTTNREYSLLTETLIKIEGWIAPTEMRTLNYNANMNMGNEKHPLSDINEFQKLIGGDSIL